MSRTTRRPKKWYGGWWSMYDDDVRLYWFPSATFRTRMIRGQVYNNVNKNVKRASKNKVRAEWRRWENKIHCGDHDVDVPNIEHMFRGERWNWD